MNIECNNCGKLVVLRNVDKYRGRTMKFKCKGESCGTIFEHFIPEEKNTELTTVVTSKSNTNNYQGNLRITNREKEIKVYKLENSITLIGRKTDHSKADILIDNDPFISKNHCFIERVKNLEFVIFDNNSRNGVFLNKQRLKNTDKIYLKEKDIISLGKTELEFFYTYNALKFKILKLYHYKHIGKRKSQEDALAISKDKKLFILCDGVGSSDNGLKASNLICEEIVKAYESRNDIGSTVDIRNLVVAASEHLNEKEEQYIATTITLLYLDKKKAFFTYLGDSRIYYYRPFTKSWKRTKDHSLVRELFDAGILTSEEEMRNHPMKNQITRSLSSTEKLELDDIEVFTIDNVVKGDYFMLCSDGVVECFDDKLLERLFLGNYKFKKISHYIQEKSSNYSKDNNSAIFIKV